MPKMTKKQKKILDSRVSRACSVAIQNLQVNVMDLGKIFQVGEDAAIAGDDDIALQSKICAFVSTLKTNASL